LKKYWLFLLQHRVNPGSIYRSTPPPIEDVRYWVEHGLTAFNIVYVRKRRGIREGEPYPAKQREDILRLLADYVPKLKAAGLYRYAYIYGFDEIGRNSYAAMKDIFGRIKQRYPDLPLMTTARVPDYGLKSGLADVVDIWTPLTARYKLDKVEAARRRGEHVWWYICIAPRHPHANWFIEYPAIDARSLMGVQSFKFKTEGFLYYTFTRWSVNDHPIRAGPYTDWNPASYKGNNGDGSLICPGPDGPLPTIRIENLRDGLEDYEYFRLLEDEMTMAERQGAHKAMLEAARKALIVGDDVVKSLTEFSKDPEAIYRKRREVAKAVVAVRRSLRIGHK